MGKRVNYAARTVISPDPFLQTNQIGIPLYFARKLTFPEPVTQVNLKEMAQAIINGPDVHPGANFIVEKDGTKISLDKLSKAQRIARSKTLMMGGKGKHNLKTVYRHVKDGDMVILNRYLVYCQNILTMDRQPTLHKPSMMGHFVKVLKTEKTMRMHYSNCSTFNADFDGDEMNIHLPQNLIARSELGKFD